MPRTGGAASPLKLSRHRAADATLGIIVKAAVLPQSMQMGFGTPTCRSTRRCAANMTSGYPLPDLAPAPVRRPVPGASPARCGAGNRQLGLVSEENDREGRKKERAGGDDPGPRKTLNTTPHTQNSAGALHGARQLAQPSGGRRIAANALQIVLGNFGCLFVLVLSI